MPARGRPAADIRANDGAESRGVEAGVPVLVGASDAAAPCSLPVSSEAMVSGAAMADPAVPPAAVASPAKAERGSDRAAASKDGADVAAPSDCRRAIPAMRGAVDDGGPVAERSTPEAAFNCAFAVFVVAAPVARGGSVERGRA